MSGKYSGKDHVYDVMFCGLHKKFGGLANNGGSRTIIRSDETLRKLGYDSRISACSDRFKFFKHRKPLKVPSRCKHVVAIDVLEIPILNLFKGARHALWLRAWPLWQMNSQQIIKRLRAFKGKIICNSSWLVRKLAKHGMEAHLCFAGYDDIWTTFGRPEKKRVTIGSLFHQRHKTKNYRMFKTLREILKPYGYDFKEVGRVHMNDDDLFSAYQGTDVWFAPTELEGFHNVPMEANLCGATVVCSNHPRNGMDDYANEETAEIYKHGDLEHAVSKILDVNHAKGKRMREHIKKNVKPRAECMKRFMEILEES